MTQQIQTLLMVLVMLGFASMELISRRYQQTVPATRNDPRREFLMFLSLLTVTQPVALLAAGELCFWLVPQWHGVLADLPWWGMVALLLLTDDLTQYWWHRASHSTVPWPLHRTHHRAPWMSIRVAYLNNFFFFMMMPGLWIAGVLLFLGFGQVYLIYTLGKVAVILGAHRAWR